MKMIKAMKKLKFWSRKKKRKRSYESYTYYQTSSTCYQDCCSFSTSTQPSAPPLPPWLEETVYAPSIAQQSQPQFPSEEVEVETSPRYPILPVNDSESYQQYMAPNPVYGLPVMQTARRERSAGFFGCFVDFGLNLIRCFCPCFHIREVYQDKLG